MVFAVSQGSLLAVQKPSYQAPSSLRLSDDYSEEYAALYRKQQSVRTVVDFLARNVAQLSLQTFQRIDDSDRKRVLDHPFARMMREPNPYTTGYRLMRDLIADRGIYDRALWVKTKTKSGDALVRIPPRLWSIADNDNWLAPSKFIIKGNRGSTPLPAEHCVYFRGYNPEDERYGLSPIESLRRILSEEFAAGQMREQSLRNGARIGGYITRPAGAEWSSAARARFSQGWRSQYAGQTATEGGGTPVLEDGMEFVAAGHSAADMQYIESRKLSREEAASAYFIPPPMVGILDHATFGNIEEQHKMLYQDTLGPHLQEIQQEIALQLIRVNFPNDADELYAEFNMLEKLRGSFEEQAQQLQTSVGAPFLTRNEARGKLNLPRIEGGDELVTPLNVTVGGQASPSDSGTQNLRALASVRVKSKRSFKSSDVNTEPHVQAAAQVLARFFHRQRDAVLSRLGAKADDGWWDEERWNDELGADLFKLAAATATELGQEQARALGFSADDYDEDRTLAFLQAVAKSRAEAINAATRDQLAAALAEDDPDPAHVFDQAVETRTNTGSTAFVAALAGFAAMEAGKQLVGPRAEKTWLVTSGNPRPEHAAMDGETVPIEDNFSNGAKWPGDPVLGADGVAGCSCEVEVTY